MWWSVLRTYLQQQGQISGYQYVCCLYYNEYLNWATQNLRLGCRLDIGNVTCWVFIGQLWCNYTGYIPDITCMGYKYYFTWLYTLETNCSYLVQWEDTAQVYNIQQWRNWLGWKGANLPPRQAKKARTGTSFTLYFGIQYSFGFQ